MLVIDLCHGYNDITCEHYIHEHWSLSGKHNTFITFKGFVLKNEKPLWRVFVLKEKSTPLEGIDFM